MRGRASAVVTTRRSRPGTRRRRRWHLTSRTQDDRPRPAGPIVVAAFRLSTRPSILAARRAGGRRFRERRSLPLRTATARALIPWSDRPLLPLLPSVREERSEYRVVSSVAARAILMQAIEGHWNWRRALIRSDLRSTTKHILLTLSVYVSEAGKGTFPSVRTLASECSLTRKTVQTHLRIGHDLGWIVVYRRHSENGRQTSNDYGLSVPHELRQGGGVSPTPSGGVSVTRGEGVTDDPLTTLRGLRKNGEDISSDQGDLLPIAKASREDFEGLWLLARRGAKGKAWEQYRSAVPAKISADAMHAARKTHVERASHLRYVKHLDLWIRDERWDEEVPESEEMSTPPEAGTDAWAAAEHDRIMGDG